MFFLCGLPAQIGPLSRVYMPSIMVTARGNALTIREIMKCRSFSGSGLWHFFLEAMLISPLRFFMPRLKTVCE